jgi:hypothetical protein
MMLAGCSGDEDKGINPQATAAQKYETLDESATATAVDVVDFLNMGLEYIDGVPVPKSVPEWFTQAGYPADSIISFDYSYSNGWYILTFEMVVDSGDASMELRIQFRKGDGTPQVIPDQNTTTLQMITDFSYAPQMYYFTGTEHLLLDLTYTGLQTAIIGCSGGGSFDIDGAGHDYDGHAYDIDATYDLAVIAVTIANPAQGGDGCPTGGTVGLAFDGTYSGYDEDGEPVSGSGTMSVTATINADETATLVFTIDGLTFTVTADICIYY